MENLYRIIITITIIIVVVVVVVVVVIIVIIFIVIASKSGHDLIPPERQKDKVHYWSEDPISYQ